MAAKQPSLRVPIDGGKAHMRGLMGKFSASDRVQVAVKALRAGLV